MRVKLPGNFRWRIINPGVCHRLYSKCSLNHLAEVDMEKGKWQLYSNPNSFHSLAEGSCETLKEGKAAVKEAMEEHGML